MSLSRTLWLFMTFMVGLSLAASSLSHQTKDESLKNALAAVTRKQRSLNSLPQDYNNDLRSFKYHGEALIKFDREEPDLDEDEEELEFLPLADNGQLETIGNGFQNLNNKRLERALIDYLDSPSVQKEAVSSLFRERERSGNRKRTLNSERFNANDKELARLFVEGLQNCAPSGEDREEAEYQPVDLSQPIYDRYKFETTNKLDTQGPISWTNVFPKNQDNNDENLALSDTYKNVPVKVGGRYVMLSVPVSRKNKDELYADTRQGHRDITKHYPITKRSPKPLAKSQVTDPKIAQDLGALFGNEEYNKTNDDNTKKLLSQIPKIETNVSPDHGNMDHIHLSKSNSNNNGNGDTTITRNPNPTIRSISRKEQQINMGKGLEHPIDVRKKSVDWSQYFGIDRRRKKTSLLARPDTQDQDVEWLLQKYYKTMADNLKTPINDMTIKNNGEKRDKLDQMDEKLKNVKNLIIEDTVRYSTTGNNNDSQEVKDIVMARLAAAHSLEKMRKALNEFRNSITAQRDIQRASSSHIKNDNSSNENKEKKQINNHDKRNNNINDDNDNDNDNDDEDNESITLEVFDEERSTNCPELEAYEIVCMPAKNIPGLLVPCVMHQVCKSCNNEDECMVLYAMEVAQICNNLPIDDDSRSYCAKTAVDIASQLDTSEFGNSLCHGTIADNCLRRFRNRHRTSSYPYAQKQQQQQHHHSVNNNGFDMTMKR